MMTTSVRVTVLATLALLALACNESKPATAAQPATTQAAAPAAPGTPKPVAAPAGKQYSIEVAPVTMKAGGKATATLKVKPGKGLKFNKDFPSKFVVTANKHAKCDKPKLSKKSGNVTIDGKTGVVTIPLTALVAGSAPLTVQASFSVCSDEQCYVLRGEMLTLPVTVK